MLAITAASAGATSISQFFTNMIGTLAVILIIAAFIGGSDLMSKLTGAKSGWKAALISGVLGGIFGIYGTMSGLQLNGAIISVRDIGPMLAGCTSGPLEKGAEDNGWHRFGDECWHGDNRC